MLVVDMTKRKNIYKLMVLYMIVCLFISTIFLVNNMQMFLRFHNNRCCFLQERNLMSQCNITSKIQNQNDGGTAVHTTQLDRVDSPDFESIFQTDVRKVLNSLKNNRFSNKNSDYKTVLNHYVIANNEDYDYKHPLSIYRGSDYNILRSMFPMKRPVNRPNEDRISKQLKLKLKFSSKKLIVVLFNSHDLSVHALKSSHCPLDKCTFTNDQSMIEQADSVVFGYNPEPVAIPHRRQHQVWIYHNLESPQYGTNIPAIQMNWTATYRSDSVIVTPYAKFTPYKNYTDLPHQAPRNYAAGKTKVAAIFVSNCYAQNGRLEYLEELKKYVRIDVYGKCGNLRCDRNKTEACHDMLKRDYKFYLAFENSNCRDYITEKFFINGLSNDVIPIVMGAHPDDYKKLAPPHSYIHVDEFDSPRQLAEYMNILDNNDDQYNLYFRWKETGEFVGTNFACRLCSMLQIANEIPMWYNDINEWWRENACILPNNNKGDLWPRWTNNPNMLKNEIISFPI